jgi:hypothetical protein
LKLILNKTVRSRQETVISDSAYFSASVALSEVVKVVPGISAAFDLSGKNT